MVIQRLPIVPGSNYTLNMRCALSSRTIWFGVVLGLYLLGAAPLSHLDTRTLASAEDDGLDVLETREGQRIPGTLLWEAPDRLRFQSAEDQQIRALTTGHRVRLGRPAGFERRVEASLPFQAVLGWEQRVSGRLIALNRERLELEINPKLGPLKIDRSGLRQLVQTPGEAQILQDSLEGQAADRWMTRGEFSISTTHSFRGKGAFQLGARGASAELRLPMAIASGRIELAFEISEKPYENAQAGLVLGFLAGPAPDEIDPIRVGIGWGSDVYSVESPRGPALVLQRLVRSAGWHRLTITFTPEAASVAIDGNLLARGRGPRGPLTQVLLETRAGRLSTAPADLACWFDELRLVQFAEASGDFEVDTSQDEARLLSGDQLFGAILDANQDQVGLQIGSEKMVLGWNEVTGLRFRTSAPTAGRPINGPLIDLLLDRGPRGESNGDRLEGVLTSLDAEQIQLDTPYASGLTLPRTQVNELLVRGPAWRLVIDNAPRHLGNERRDNLDPPQPEGTRRDWEFSLEKLPSDTPSLVLDVLEVAGMSEHLKFSDRVRAGLRANVLMNGKLVDNINRHVLTNNEVPERVRIPLPKDLLRIGRNTATIELVGTKADPMDLDDMAVLGVALEFTSGIPPQPPNSNSKP